MKFPFSKSWASAEMQDCINNLPAGIECTVWYRGGKSRTRKDIDYTEKGVRQITIDTADNGQIFTYDSNFNEGFFIYKCLDFANTSPSPHIAKEKKEEIAITLKEDIKSFLGVDNRHDDQMLPTEWMSICIPALNPEELERLIKLISQIDYTFPIMSLDIHLDSGTPEELAKLSDLVMELNTEKNFGKTKSDTV